MNNRNYMLLAVMLLLGGCVMIPRPVVKETPDFYYLPADSPSLRGGDEDACCKADVI